MSDAPKMLWVDWTPADDDTMPATMAAHTSKSNDRAAFRRVDYIRADVARAELEAAVLAECDRCAGVADDHTPGKFAAPLVAHVTGASIAAAIRARSET